MKTKHIETIGYFTASLILLGFLIAGNIIN